MSQVRNQYSYSTVKHGYKKKSLVILALLNTTPKEYNTFTPSGVVMEPFLSVSFFDAIFLQSIFSWDLPLGLLVLMTKAVGGPPMADIT